LRYCLPGQPGLRCNDDEVISRAEAVAVLVDYLNQAVRPRWVLMLYFGGGVRVKVV
jgi:hypothetical protein